jgi:hypothetical protein
MSRIQSEGTSFALCENEEKGCVLCCAVTVINSKN